MTTNNTHSSMPPSTSTFSTDPDTRSDTTAKNMPPLTTPTTGTSEDQNSDATRTTNAHITMLATSSSVITRYTKPATASRSTTTSSNASHKKGFQEQAGENSNGLTIGGAIGGIVIFVVITGTVIVLIAFMLHRRKKSKSTKFEGVDNIIYNNNEGT